MSVQLLRVSAWRTWGAELLALSAYNSSVGAARVPGCGVLAPHPGAVAAAGFCDGLAERLGLRRQRVNYHAHELEKAGLLEDEGFAAFPRAGAGG